MFCSSHLEAYKSVAKATRVWNVHWRPTVWSAWTFDRSLSSCCWMVPHLWVVMFRCFAASSLVTSFQTLVLTAGCFTASTSADPNRRTDGLSGVDILQPLTGRKSSTAEASDRRGDKNSALGHSEHDMRLLLLEARWSRDRWAGTHQSL